MALSLVLPYPESHQWPASVTLSLVLPYLFISQSRHLIYFVCVLYSHGLGGLDIHIWYYQLLPNNGHIATSNRGVPCACDSFSSSFWGSPLRTWALKPALWVWMPACDFLPLLPRPTYLTFLRLCCLCILNKKCLFLQKTLNETTKNKMFTSW